MHAANAGHVGTTALSTGTRARPASPRPFRQTGTRAFEPPTPGGGAYCRRAASLVAMLMSAYRFVGGEVDVAEPAAAHADLDAGLEEMDSCRVAKNVGTDPAGSRTLVLQTGRMPPDELVDTEPRERLARRRTEHRRLRRRRFTHKLPKQACCLVPQGARPPFPALAVEPGAGSTLEIEVAEKEENLVHSVSCSIAWAAERAPAARTPTQGEARDTASQ